MSVVNIQEEFQKIYDEHGELDPQLVVDVARPAKHPLHPVIFDIDEDDAAEAYYRERARYLIRHIRITYPKRSGEPLEVRAWHAVPTDQGYTFKPNDEVARDPVMRELVMREMARDWKGLHDRYIQFEEFVKMVQRDLAKARRKAS